MSIRVFKKRSNRSEERWFQMMRQAMLFRQFRVDINPPGLFSVRFKAGIPLPPDRAGPDGC